MQRTIGRFFFTTVVAAVVVIMNGTAFAQQVSGAIFTTDHNSSFVNGNVYDSMEDVYLNGGPRPNAPCTAAGLPAGEYVFQVTDPSGSQLLSSDPIEYRRVTVSDGLIINATAFHNFGIGKCLGLSPANITVQLAPFMPTPNPGGEYKVWITKFSDYDVTMTKGSFGFIPSKSKTDNFKVVAPEYPSVDTDGDGIPDSQDPCPMDSDLNCEPVFG
jgi:hypothetical protein